MFLIVYLRQMKFILLLFIMLITVACNNTTNNKNNEIEEDKIVFSNNNGNIIKESDLSEMTVVNFKVMNDKNVDKEAIDLHNQARVLGQEGNYDEAIVKLKRAIEIQPDWAYPPYDLAFTYLLKGDSEKALYYYNLTDSLGPQGFFTAKTAIYSLEGEKNGKFPKGIYLAYMQIEWAAETSKKLEIAKAITEKVPNYAPAWKELSNLLEDNSERLSAIEKGLENQPDAETKGLLIINKALVMGEQKKEKEAIDLLGNLIFSEDATTSNKALAKLALKSITEKE